MIVAGCRLFDVKAEKRVDDLDNRKLVISKAPTQH